MKIEMGESLLQSFLKYIKICPITQTNWKSSASWNISKNNLDSVTQLFTLIQKHKDFSSVFKGVSLEQAIKQAEVDVVGISNDKLYMVEVAFHEFGLRYGSKVQTKDRICKKLLRAYMIGLAYFPNFSYEIIFASPKVNPATDKIIQNYFSTLMTDFGEPGKVEFRYIANDEFKQEILLPTLKASQKDSDTSDLFIRSTKLLELFDCLDAKRNRLKLGNQNKQPKLNSLSLNKSKDVIKEMLRSIGKTVFVEYFEYFNDPNYSVNDITSILKKKGMYKDNVAESKASVGKRIIREGLAKDALEVISIAKKIKPQAVEKAKKLLKKL